MATPYDQERFSALVREHAGIVRKVATTYCRGADDRADLAQEILAQLWAAWPRYDVARPFTTWMYRVALNVAISHVRGVYRGARHFVPLTDAHHEIAAAGHDHEARDELEALETVIAELGQLNRALLLLYLDDRSHREIAEILGISESNVGTKINRLKQRIRARFA
ncbi:MAG TPA: sigma-70 family RNA polymerase sigma factor [Allosphingosinicella sp.]|nr:sigma-70 family RNA polymerase sigma factor [Allosphingosinicella sp.]